jgi:hypothetical protein
MGPKLTLQEMCSSLLTREYVLDYDGHNLEVTKDKKYYIFSLNNYHQHSDYTDLYLEIICAFDKFKKPSKAPQKAKEELDYYTTLENF